MLHGFVDAGNTVLVVEHNLDVVKTADWIIDLGPEGGEEGGYVVASGTPEEIVEQRRSSRIRNRVHSRTKTKLAIQKSKSKIKNSLPTPPKR